MKVVFFARDPPPTSHSIPHPIPHFISSHLSFLSSSHPSFWGLSQLWKAKTLSLKVKKDMYFSFVVSVLLNAAETWAPTQEELTLIERPYHRLVWEDAYDLDRWTSKCAAKVPPALPGHENHERDPDLERDNRAMAEWDRDASHLIVFEAYDSDESDVE